MSAGTTRVVAAVRQTVLTVGAVAGVVCLLLTVAGFAFGVRPLVFLSGSMNPTIDTGALAIARTVPAGDLGIGDIVSVPLPSGQRVTHRIVAVQHTDHGAAELRLKGDANEAVDPSPYRVSDADVVLFAIPGLGYAVSWLNSPAGVFLLGLYAALLLSVLVRGERRPPGRRVLRPVPATPVARPVGRHRAGPQHRRPQAAVLVLTRGLVPTWPTGGRHRTLPAPTPPRRRSRPALAVPVTAATVVAGGWVAGSAEPTLAAWADPAEVAGTTLSAYTVPAPNGDTCTVLDPGTDTARGVDLSWPGGADPPLKYDTSVAGLTGATATVVGAGADTRLEVRYDPGLVDNHDQTVTVQAVPRLSSAAAWAGPATTWTFRTGSDESAQPACGP